MSNIKKHSYAVTLLFILNGCLLGSWAVKIPYFKQELALNEHSLSILLLALALGAVISFPFAGWLTNKFGLKRLSQIAYFLYPAIFVCLAFVNNYIQLFIVLFLFGFLHGALDVVMNAWGVQTETLSNKKIMPFFHAMFSLGAGLGAAMSVFMVWLDISTLIHFLIVVVIFAPFYPAVSTAPSFTSQTEKTEIDNSQNKLPIALLVSIGLIACWCALGEGVIADWSAVIMRQEFGAGMSFSGWAYAMFSIFMVISRLLGHLFINKYGDKTVVQFSAMFSLLGSVLIIWTPNANLALVGFAFLGIGYSVIVPIVFSKAAQVNPNEPAKSIAFVATFVYGGMLCGPVIIGFLAHQSSLKNALYLLVILSIYTFFTSGLLKETKAAV